MTKEQIRVLYVDDEPSLLELCKVYLERLGDFTVTTVPSAPEAIRILELKRFDAIVSDYQMPDMDGIEFLKVVRARGDKTPFIIFTGKGREAVVIDALNAGADFYLQKGGEPKAQFAELAYKIKKAVEGRRAEAALRKERDFANSVVGTAQAIVLILDTAGHIVYINPYMEGISGYILEEVKGKDWFETFLPSHIQESVRSLFRKAIGDIKTRGNVDAIITKNGRELLIEWYDTTLKGADGSIEGLLAIGQDVTDKKKVEEALQESEKQYHSILDSMQDAYVRADAKGHIIMVSTSATHLFRYDSVNELIGLPAASLYRYPEERQEIIRIVKEQGEVHDFICEGVRKDGTSFWVSINVQFTFDSNGKVTGTDGFIRDITNRKRIEEVLHVSEARYRTVVEDQTEFICRFTPDGRLTFVNDAYCRYFSLAKDQCLTHPHTVVLPPEDVRQMKQHLASLTPQNPVATIEHRIIMPSGEVRWQRWNDRAIFDKKGQVIEYQSVGRDITEIKNTEKTLRESEAYYRAIFENTGTASVIVEEDTMISLANAEFANLCGYSREEIEGKRHWTEFVVKEDLERMLAQHRLRRKDRKLAERHYEFRFVRKNGEVRNIFLSIDVIPGTKKSIASLLDITGYKKAEQALRESEERYRTLVASVNEAIILQEKTGEILTWNRAAERLFGVTAREVMGHTATSLKWKTIREDGTEFPDSEHPSMHTLATGEACKNVVMGITNDEGRSSWVNINTSPLFRQGDAKPYAVVVSFLDITERKQTDEALRETNEYLQKLIDFANAPIIVWDPDFRITRFNHAFEHLTGRIEQEVLGQKIDILFPADSREASLALIKKTLEGERWETVEIPILASDGTIHTVLWNTANILTAEAELISTIAQGVDITERKRAEDMIKSALAEKEVLLREIHHRVKNNLAGIISLIDLQIGSVSDPVTISLLKDLETRIRSMALVHESLYRTEDLTHISFTSYTENLTRYLFQAYEPGTNIRCRIEMGDVTMPIETAIPCGLVISEIVTNSLKYAFPGTFSCNDQRCEPCTITLTLHREGSDYLLKIADNGTGIPEGTDVTMSHSLGLFLIGFIVKHQMRGSLDVSTAGGTAYTIRFPAPEVKERNNDE